jgi:uncharacterized protein (DUF488 family)
LALEDFPLLYTIGHSTRGLDELVALLLGFGVRLVVDIRTVPRSRHNPQFDHDALAASLPAHGLDYLHMKSLGGLRHPRADSPNSGWRNASFRGFADYMQTEEFGQALEELVRLAGKRRTAIMCAEAVPWRCHRYLIADALLVRGHGVEHIMGQGTSRRHTLNPLASLEEGKLRYPSPPGGSRSGGSPA